MTARIGRTLAAALRDTASSGPVPAPHKAALLRAGLWEKDMERPHDRVAAIRMGDMARGFAMHSALDHLALLDEEAVTRYEAASSIVGKEVSDADVVDLWKKWPAEWRRLNGAVPLDALWVGLVSLGFAPPSSLRELHNYHFESLRRESGGYVLSWPNLNLYLPRETP